MAAPILTDTTNVEPVIIKRIVTPEMAATWVDEAVNRGNRPVKIHHVNMLAKEMAEGRWRFNADPIRLSVTGRLLDGQHRLLAQMQVGVCLEYAVATNLPDDVQATIDTGARRTAGDLLGMQGLHHSNTLASMAKLSADIEAYTRRERTGKVAPSRISAIVATNPTMLWVSQNVLSSMPSRLCSLTVLGYCYTRLHDIDPDDCARFFHGLNHPYDLGAGSPIAALHRRLAHGPKIRSGVRERIQLVSMVFTAWNAWRKGEQRKISKASVRDDGTVPVPDPV